MNKKHVPLRTCVISHEKCEKKDLIRIVRTPLKDVVVDLTGKLNGRGAYIKKDLDVIEKARKTKALNKHLEVEVPESIYEELINLVKKV